MALHFGCSSELGICVLRMENASNEESIGCEEVDVLFFFLFAFSYDLLLYRCAIDGYCSRTYERKQREY